MLRAARGKGVEEPISKNMERSCASGSVSAPRITSANMATRSITDGIAAPLWSTTHRMRG